MVPFERAMVVSYRLSIVTTALSLTNLSSNVSDTQINRRWITLWQNLGTKGNRAVLLHYRRSRTHRLATIHNATDDDDDIRNTVA